MWFAYSGSQATQPNESVWHINLLWLQEEVCPFQFPEVWQLLELDPDLEYPWLHVKSALVSTGYPPFNTDLLYVICPFDRLSDSQVTRKYNLQVWIQYASYQILSILHLFIYQSRKI